jgi:hypothetical protein
MWLKRFMSVNKGQVHDDLDNRGAWRSSLVIRGDALTGLVTRADGVINALLLSVEFDGDVA